MATKTTKGTKKKISLVFFVFLVAFVPLVAGTFARAQEGPRRIISFIPAVTEMLFALGVGDRVVAVGSF
ncbi:MAG: hypothetical protein WD227_11335, partial [Vicinamibacterales bacterium]